MENLQLKMIYVKRYFNENSGQELTDAWGTCTYYFETDEKGEVSKQMEIFYNSKVLKYSELNKVDEFGGLSLVALDLADEGYIKITKEEFSGLWDRANINEYLYNPLRISKFWKIDVMRLKPNITENQLKKAGSIVVLTSLDGRFGFHAQYESENHKFSIKINEGSVVIFHQLYKAWSEVVTATNNWLWEIENAAKNMHDNPADELSLPVQLVINADLQICLLTTWRNMEWGVFKLRNVELRSNEGIIYLEETFGFMEEALTAIQNQLPVNQFFRCCTFCRFATYIDDTHAHLGDLHCMKNCKKQYLKIKTLRGFRGLLEREKDYIAKVNETHLCDQFERIDGLNWTFKDKLIEPGL
jgi:hypothetical protein